MSTPDFVLRTLNQRYQRCLAPSRQQRTTLRWQRYPALAGRTVSEIAAVITDGYHPDHNPVAAALLEAHHHRRDLTDDDAITLLLVAIRPLVLLLDPHDADNDGRASMWHDAGRCLATLTPAEILDHRSPFLVVTFGRLRAGRTTRHARRPAGTLQIAPQDPTDICGRNRDIVADRVIARIDLQQLTQQPGWNRLAAWLEHGSEISGEHRQWVARTRRQMAETVGYAA